MIVTRVENRLRIVTQADHARFAADMLALFRLPELALHPRRADLLFAIREHDNGWWETDAAPRIDPGGGTPLDFRTTPRPERFALWRRGVARHVERHPYPTALIAGHAIRLFAGENANAEGRAFLAGLAESRAEALDRSSATPGDATRDDRWMELADNLSLAVALLASDRSRLHGFEFVVGADASVASLAIEPFPLAGSTRLSLACRHLEARRFAADSDYALALAVASWEDLPVRVLPSRKVGPGAALAG